MQRLTVSSIICERYNFWTYDFMAIGLCVFIFIFYLMQSILCYVVLPNVEIYLEEAHAISLQKHNSQFLRH